MCLNIRVRLLKTNKQKERPPAQDNTLHYHCNVQKTMHCTQDDIIHCAIHCTSNNLHLSKCVRIEATVVNERRRFSPLGCRLQAGLQNKGATLHSTTVLFHTVLHSTVLYSTILPCTLLHCTLVTVPYYTGLH